MSAQTTVSPAARFTVTAGEPMTPVKAGNDPL